MENFHERNNCDWLSLKSQIYDSQRCTTYIVRHWPVSNAADAFHSKAQTNLWTNSLIQIHSFQVRLVRAVRVWHSGQGYQWVTFSGLHWLAPCKENIRFPNLGILQQAPNYPNRPTQSNRKSSIFNANWNNLAKSTSIKSGHVNHLLIKNQLRWFPWDFHWNFIWNFTGNFIGNRVRIKGNDEFVQLIRSNPKNFHMLRPLRSRQRLEVAASAFHTEMSGRF